MEIKGKVFIVTGGASGLGEGTARMLAAQGGTVVIADMQTDKGEQVAKDIGGAFVKCDVSNEADGQVVVAKAVSLGKLMGLVNCAGIAPAEKTVGKNGAGRRGHVQERPRVHRRARRDDLHRQRGRL
jgi:NAD(P)-dependent dehydrogenase (short-subunit alcohol dehydrogenase family)